ncbi:MAG: malto-oligosyltrehalose synthase [Dehalococcoidia bacterium]
MEPLRSPVSTYRLQLHDDFGFADAREIVHYLNRLGISDLYTSPIFQAREGSTHGYDTVNPTRLDPRLGSAQDFSLLAGELKNHSMGLLLDIVPNHMAASHENPWWMDVLENGRCSPYSDFFDINWEKEGLESRVLLPFLGSDREEVLTQGEFSLELVEEGLFLRYYENRFPLDIGSCRLVLSAALELPEKRLNLDPELRGRLIDIAERMAQLPGAVDLSQDDAEDYHQRQAIKREFLGLVNNSPDAGRAIREGMKEFFAGRNKDTAERLLAEQVYRLEFWKSGLSEINYRRFFDIAELVGIRTEDPKVFREIHDLVLRLARRGDITGIRIDHIDGLLDPDQYLGRLEAACEENTEATPSRPFFCLVEKILAGNELLPAGWTAFGTTGYDYLNVLNRLFVDAEGARRMQQAYVELTGVSGGFGDIVYEKKKQVMRGLFPGEIRELVRGFVNLPGLALQEEQFTEEDISEAIIEVSACLPVYRTYISRDQSSPSDGWYIEQALDKASRRDENLPEKLIDCLRNVLLSTFPAYLPEEEREAWIGWTMKWQQFTGPAMAKGFEDTALYNYNFLISLSEVGGNPGMVHFSPSFFHQHNIGMQRSWPYTMNATSTHDTKRSEDVRSRINVLSEDPDAWTVRFSEWGRLNHGRKSVVDGSPVPEPAMETLLYQTLLGAWPLEQSAIEGFKERLKGYLIKVAREAKVRSHWHSPNEEYEQALIEFAMSILEDERGPFLDDFLGFQRWIAFYGAVNSLSQVLLKVTSPGIPDFYQGSELWDLSLVDPDNRRPVDYRLRQKFLAELLTRSKEGLDELISELLASWEDGRIKMFVTSTALNIRKEDPDLFRAGEYITLQAPGRAGQHVCAFGRRADGRWVVVAVPRMVSRLCAPGEWPVGWEVWGEDALVLPPAFSGEAVNLFTGERLRTGEGSSELPLANAFAGFPLALLYCRG